MQPLVPNLWLAAASLLLAVIAMLIEYFSFLPFQRPAAFWFAISAWVVLFLATFIFPKSWRSDPPTT